MCPGPKKTAVFSSPAPGPARKASFRTVIWASGEVAGRTTLLPVAISMWDARGELQGSYIYKDLRLNVGLTDEDFSPESCSLVD